MTTPTDPLYADQWHFPLIGDVESVWDDYTGDGVTVAVYDEGVQYTHPDLNDNYDASMHFTYNGVVYDPMPITGNQGHGTSCAGLIGAEANNGIGGTGVAYDVTITGVNYLEDIQFAEQDVYDAAMIYAAEFDIMSNSWGYSTGFTNFQNLSDPTSSTSHDEAIWQGVNAIGRDGLGTIILKAAGNETKNVNGDGINVSRTTITVAATDNLGNATYYTNYGSAVLIAAPASGVTTDMTGDDGYNAAGDSDPFPVDYTSEFNGTSAATPTAAGVVALMLEANPELGWRDVNNILALSASHTGSALGGPGSGEEVGSWQLMGGTTWNGGGTMFHQSYGYGMVDAFAAVRMAEAWDVLYANQGSQASANEQIVSAAYVGGVVKIPDNNGVAGTGIAALQIVSTSDITIETIYITIDISHTNSNDLMLWLRAPDGEMIEIYNADGNKRTMDGGLTWTFGVESLRGYSSEGTWTVVAEDTVTGNVGTLQGANITFFGSAATNDDVYHFTDDFMALAAIEASRQTIDDTNGGVDWLNFAVYSDNMNVDMNAGGAIVSGGVTIAHLAAGPIDFENLYLGDGNDTVTGNALGNHIVGARGNDSVHGNNGNDWIEGYDENDRLFGDRNNDTISGGSGNDLINGGTGIDSLNGNAGLDTFIFNPGFGIDTIAGFEDNIDRLKLDDAIWGGGKTVAQVIATYAHVVGANTVFDFNNGNKFTVLGVTNLAVFQDDITIF